MREHTNDVELQGWYGGDREHALSAWTSTSRELSPEKIARIPELLSRLAQQGHETPFEKSALHFLVTSDIASHIHALKHRIAVSINAESARYKELKDDKFYLPVDWPEDERQALEQHCLRAFDLYHATINRLVNGGMDRKRAKETARFYLPYATQLTWDVQFNFRSFVHFMRLRHEKHAQKEIFQIADAMLNLVWYNTNGDFEHSLAAFGLFG